MYRFRSLDNLLGKHKELEKQEIYFAPLNKLNDPMEGYRKYYWKGDKIIWKNLFKHYILCLEHTINMCRLYEDKEIELYQSLPIYLIKDDLPTDLYKNRLDRIYKLFFKDEFIKCFLNVISSNPYKVYKEELHFYLRAIHTRAIEAIKKIDVEDDIIEDKDFIPRELKQYNYKNINIKELWSKSNENKYRDLIKIINNTLKELNTEILIKMQGNPKRETVFIDFPELYADQILELVYPNVYVACFMEDYRDSSIWGTYGYNHTGVCLKFKTDISSPKLKLKGISSWSSRNGYDYEFQDFDLKPIIYTNKVYELDFFANLGKLPMTKIQQWYKGENGEVSICANSIFSNEEEWKKKHWEQFEPSLLRKIPDWKKEKEYRIVLTSLLDWYEGSNNRLLQYDFNDLETLIFGMKTPREKRLEIIEIIKKKCKENNRKSFDFYEMHYQSFNNILESEKIYSINLE